MARGHRAEAPVLMRGRKCAPGGRGACRSATSATVMEWRVRFSKGFRALSLILAPLQGARSFLAVTGGLRESTARLISGNPPGWLERADGPVRGNGAWVHGATKATEQKRWRASAIQDAGASPDGAGLVA